MKLAAGITALLTACPPCFGTEMKDRSESEHVSMHPLTSGSICRVRDSLDRLDPKERTKATLARRVEVAKEEFQNRPVCHISNGDEDNLEGFIGQFHKSLPHDKFGNVDTNAYEKLMDCAFSGDINVCEDVPAGTRGGSRLANPLGGQPQQVDGADSDAVFLATPSALLSAELAAQQIEVYWMALARDVPFEEYGTNEITCTAAADLESLPAFKGLNIAKDANGKIDPQQALFRTDWPGVTTGPVVSQFMLQPFIIDGIRVFPKQETFAPGADYMTAFKDWLDVQNGDVTVDNQFDPNPLFIRNGRDLAHLAFVDVTYSEAIRAAYIMFTNGVLGEVVGPYKDSKRQGGFATFGLSHIVTALAASNSATRHAWYTKWNVHRQLRPEAYGGLVHNTVTKRQITDLDPSILKNSDLLNRIAKNNAAQNPDGEKTFLLPMAVSEGSPVHPAYPSGHAINLGAFITTLKAFLGFDGGQLCYPDPVVSNVEGTATVPFKPSKGQQLDTCIDEDGKKTHGLTYEGELNKIASNVIIGRSYLGVHWRMDGTEGAKMGEAGAVRRLQQELGGLAEARDDDDEDNDECRKGSNDKKDKDDISPATYTFRLFSGQVIELVADSFFFLDGRKCRGLFTGGDFCDEDTTYDEDEDSDKQRKERKTWSKRRKNAQNNDGEKKQFSLFGITAEL